MNSTDRRKLRQKERALREEAKALRESQKGLSNIEILKAIDDKKKAELCDGAIEVSEYFGVAGIYFLFKDNELVYIGESTCVFTRLSQHFKNTEKEFNSFKFEVFNGTNEDRREKEAKLIKRFRPILNSTHNPNIKLG